MPHGDPPNELVEIMVLATTWEQEAEEKGYDYDVYDDFIDKRLREIGERLRKLVDNWEAEKSDGSSG